MRTGVSRRAATLLGALLAMSRAQAADVPAKVAPMKTSAQVCVQVHIGTTRTVDFHCLNDLMEMLVERESTRQAALRAAQDSVLAQSPTQIGLFNVSATKQRLGTAFGHSAFPQRPPATYHIPLVH